MSKALLVVLVAVAVAVGGGFFFLTQMPPAATVPAFVWAAGLIVTSALAGVQWAVYTAANDPAKLARLVAEHLPADDILALLASGKDTFSTAVERAAKELGKL